MANTNDLSYPFDPTGSLASNLIKNEQAVITAVAYNDYHTWIPAAAPFFLDSMQLTLVQQDGTKKPLVMGVDWYGCFEFIGASRACAKPIWGGIAFLNTQLAGQISMQYQTLGGIWTLTAQAISQLLAYNLHDPRVTAWEEVANPPIAFPPIDHEWDLVDLVGASDIVTALQTIEDAIRAANGSDFAQHLSDFDNPHRTTASQTGLDQVQNYPIATSTDVSQGTSNRVYMTPAMTYLMINGSNSPGAALSQHINDHTNPHQVTAQQTGAYSTQQTDQLLAAKLGSTATAADSVKFNGMDENQYASFVLNNGTAANSLEFGGLTPAQFTQQVLQGTAANSTKFNGMSASDYAAQVLQGKAADSALFNGQTPTQFTAAVLTGKAADSALFNGQTPAQFTAAVLQGKAADSSLLNGQTAAQILSGAVKQQQWGQTLGETGTDYWEEIGQVVLPLDSNVQNWPDSQWFIGGGGANGETIDTLYLIQVGVRGPSGSQVTLQVTDFTANAPAATFGYSIATINSTQTVRVWMHTGPNRDPITGTVLSGIGTLLTTPNRVSAAPSGITMVAGGGGGFATSQQLSAVVQSMTDMFNQIEQQLNNS